MLKETLQLIERGKLGLNVGLPHGHERLSGSIPNIQQGTYYLVGAELGVGKTAWVDELFVIRLIEHMIKENSDFKLKIIYFSFEIEKRLKMAKFISYYIYSRYGILTNVNMILSRGKNRIPDDIYGLVISSLDHMEHYSDYLDIYDKNVNPTGIWEYMQDYAKDNGKWIESDKTSTYVPNNNKLFTIFIIDHVNLMSLERGFNRKQNIDKMSEYSIILRNKCNFIPVIVQQLNRSIGSADRFRIDRVEPQLTDFKDTATTGEDANIVMSLFSPMRYEIEQYRGYDIRRLRNRFRSLQLLKNRDGDADKQYGFHFLGEIGMFNELKPAKEMLIKDYDSIT